MKIELFYKHWFYKPVYEHKDYKYSIDLIDCCENKDGKFVINFQKIEQKIEYIYDENPHH